MDLIDVLKLPSRLQVKQVAKVHFNESPITGTIIGVHFYKDKVKYDIELWIQTKNGEEYTRIYNVDSVYVSPL